MTHRNIRANTLFMLPQNLYDFHIATAFSTVLITIITKENITIQKIHVKSYENTGLLQQEETENIIKRQCINKDAGQADFTVADH